MYAYAPRPPPSPPIILIAALSIMATIKIMRKK